MSQIQNLRSYILKECEKNKDVSLINIMAIFDFHQHIIPTLNEMRQAIKGIENINIKRKDNIVYLYLKENSSSVNIKDINEEDMQVTYNAYIKQTKNK